MSKDSVFDNENIYFRFFNHSPMACMQLNEDGVIVQSNNKVASLLKVEGTANGYPLLNFVHPSHTEKFKTLFNKLSAGKSFEHEELHFQHFIAKIFASKTTIEGSDYLLFSMMDNTAEYESRFQNALRDSQLKGILENAQDVLFSLNQDGRFEYISKSWETLTGYQVSETIGKLAFDFATSKDKLLMKDRLGLFFGGKIKKGQMEYEFLDKNGNSVFIEVRASLQHSLNNSPTLIGVARDITEDKRNTDQMNLLSNMINNINQAMIGIDVEGNVNYWNSQAEKIFGYSKDEIIGKNVDQLFPRSLTSSTKQLNFNINETSLASTALDLYHKNGSSFRASVKDYPVFLDSGKENGKIRVVTEWSASEFNDTQIKLLQNLSNLQIEVSAEFINTQPSDYTNAIQSSVEHISKYVKSEAIAVCEIDEDDKNKFRYIAQWSSSQSFKGFPDVTHSFLTKLKKKLNEKEFVVATLFDHSDLLHPINKLNKQIREALYFPIISKAELIGFIVIGRSTGLVYEEIPENLIIIAQHFSGAIQLAQTERKREKENKLFKTIAENTSDGIAVRKGEKFTYMSPAYLSVLGFTQEEEEFFTLEDFFKLVHPVDKEMLYAEITACMSSQKPSGDFLYRIQHKDGHFLWREDHVKYIYNEQGSLQEMYIVARDVTEQIENRNKLQQREKQAKALIDALPDLVFRLDKNGYYTYFKASQEDLFVPEHLIIGSHYSDLIPKHVASLLNEAIEKLKTTEKLQRFTYSLIIPSRGMRHFDARIIASGEDEVTVISRDITEEVENLNTLKTLKSAVNQSPVSVMITNTDHIITYVNDHFCATTGYTSEEVIGTSPSLLSTGYTSKVEYDSLKEILEKGETWSGEFLNKKKNGEHYWESAVISPVLNEAGEIFRYIAVKEDVSELKKLNNELERLSLVASKAQDRVVITDADSKIEWVNPSFEQATGYSLDEVIGKVPGHFLQGEETAQADVEAMRKGVRSKLPFTQKILNYTKEKVAYWVDCNITPIFNKNGELVNYIAVERDITSLVTAESELKNERNLLKTLVNNLPSIVFMKNNKFERILCNHTDVKFQGVNTEEDLIGKTDFDLYPLALAQQFRKEDEAIMRTKKPLLNKEVQVSKNGTKQWFLVSKIPVLDHQKNVTGIIGIGKEITELKLREKELRDAVSVMSVQNKSLENFAYIVSHNMRAHAANIESLIQLLQVETDDSLKASYQDMISQVSKKQLDTLGNLNEVINIKSKGNELEVSELNICTEINNALVILRNEINNSGVAIELNVSNELSIWSNKVYFESIVQNLISNGIKYRNTSIKNPFVKISCIEENNELLISIEDNGLGIDVERYKDRLFGMNQTFHNNPTARGIGLFLVKNQVTALGGEVWVESEPQLGSKFIVKLPIK